MAETAAPVDLPLTGGCGCGAVRFELSAPLLLAAYCHCTLCQRRTGTAVQASALATYDSLRVTRGSEHIRQWKPNDANAKAFCAECGSSLFAMNQADEKIVFVRLGAIDGDPGVRPTVRQFVADAALWEPIPDDGLPRFDGRADFSQLG